MAWIFVSLFLFLVSLFGFGRPVCDPSLHRVLYKSSEALRGENESELCLKVSGH